MSKDIEVIDFLADIDKRSWFSHLLLGGDIEGLSGSNFDSSKLEISLKVNGYPVRVGDFNQVLSEWSDGIASDLKSKMLYNDSEEAVQSAAKKLIEDKLGNIRCRLDEVEESLWKLDGYDE